MKEILDAVLIKEVVYPLLIIFIGLLIYLIISTSIKRVFNLKLGKVDKRRAKTLGGLINNILKYLILILCTLSILEVYGISTKGFITSLGVVGLVAGLAFQDTLKDFLAGFSLIFENAYAVGDTVTIGDFKGKVISLGLKTTKLQSMNGDIKIISNSKIDFVVNHTLDDTYEFIDIPVAYETDIEKVEKVLNEVIIDELKNNDKIKDAELLGLEKLDSSSVNFRIMVKIEHLNKYQVKREILKHVKIELDKNNITIPYNQVVIHNARV